MKVKGNLLKNEIFSNGYSMKEFSDKVDISRTYMSSVVNGNKGLSPRNAKNIANVLDVEIKDIFYFDEKEA